MIRSVDVLYSSRCEAALQAEQRGLRWYSHMESMNDERMAKKMMNSMAEGVAGRGRPKLGWEEGIRNSLLAKETPVQEGRVKPLDRKE